MGTAYLFYNPLAGSGQIHEDLEVMEFILDDPCVCCDMTKPETYGETLFQMSDEDYLVICGGDGTLNRFVNLTRDLRLSRQIYWYPVGQHNDFARDHNRGYGCNPFPVTDQLKKLPVFSTENRKTLFLTGILYHPNATFRRTSPHKKRYHESVIVSAWVDGQPQRYERVQFAAVMYGKHCCGGMVPDSNRDRKDGDLSCVVIHNCGKLKAGYLLRKLEKHRKIQSGCLSISRGIQIRLSFDRPVSLLADGEEQPGIRMLTACVPEKQTSFPTNLDSLFQQKYPGMIPSEVNGN